MTNRVGEFLAHYASQFYDPAKAHEYYLKTRELKGLPGAKGKNANQTEAMAYARNQISIARKADLQKTQTDHKSQVEAVRKQAEANRLQIEAKLKDLVTKIMSEAMTPATPQFKPVPISASPAQRNAIIRQNAVIAKNAQKAAAGAALVAKKAAGEKIKQVGADLKAAVADAHSKYTEARKQTVANYQATTNKELANIRTQVR